MEPGDIIIDGGNSNYREDIDRAAALKPKGIHYVDIGTSGGVCGLERGYCLMIGGEDEVVAHLDPLLQTIAPGRRRRSSARPAAPASRRAAEQGYLHCGPNGAGHFVKMVHNGIEYGMMAAYAEGLNVLHHANAGALAAGALGRGRRRSTSRSTTSSTSTSPKVAEVWRRGSVVASWLLDLTAGALHGQPEPGRPGRAGLGLRRGPLDGQGRDRRGRPDAGAVGGAVRPVLQPRRGRLRGQAAVGHAQGVRRARRAAHRRVAPCSSDVLP